MTFEITFEADPRSPDRYPALVILTTDGGKQTSTRLAPSSAVAFFITLRHELQGMLMSLPSRSAEEPLKMLEAAQRIERLT